MSSTSAVNSSSSAGWGDYPGPGNIVIGDYDQHYQDMYLRQPSNTYTVFPNYPSPAVTVTNVVRVFTNEDSNSGPIDLNWCAVYVGDDYVEAVFLLNPLSGRRWSRTVFDRRIYSIQNCSLWGDPNFMGPLPVPTGCVRCEGTKQDFDSSLNAAGFPLLSSGNGGVNISGYNFELRGTPAVEAVKEKEDVDESEELALEPRRVIEL